MRKWARIRIIIIKPLVRAEENWSSLSWHLLQPTPESLFLKGFPVMRNYSGTVVQWASVGCSDGADGRWGGAACSRLFSQRSGQVLLNRVLATACAAAKNKHVVFGTATGFSLTFKNRASFIWDGRTATFQMLHFIYFFLTNISTEYFKHAAHSPFCSSKCRLFHNATFFGSCVIYILHTGVR
jgi:hypothetical protein